MAEMSNSDVNSLKDCFDTFDFFNALRGTVDGTMVGDILRCAKLNPTTEIILKNGGATERGQTELSFDQVLDARKLICADPKNEGVYEDYKELFLSFDRDATGIVHNCEFEHLLKNLGDKLNVEIYDEIFKDTEVTLDEDGFIMYESFLSKLMKGHPSTWAK